MTKSELKQLIQECVEETLNILSGENSIEAIEKEAHMDDSNFLRKYWKLPLEQLESFLIKLKRLEEVEKRISKFARGNYVTMYKRSLKDTQKKIEYLTYIINSKKEKPDYIPDDWK
jgi:hypothetical protein